MLIDDTLMWCRTFQLAGGFIFSAAALASEAAADRRARRRLRSRGRARLKFRSMAVLGTQR
eukprot:scaffold54311_cov63-Phaeocystis_antarctica.AAC.6